MKITSIQYINATKTGLLLNGTLSVPWPCNTWHKELVQNWLDEGGVIDPFQTPEEAAAAKELERVATWKRECRIRIFERYSDSDQRNGAMEAFILLQRLVSGDALSAAEQMRIQTLNEAKSWISAMVQFCRTNITDPARPVHSDSVRWPAPPPEG